MLTGFIEPTNVNDFQFETQRRTFLSYGYANDPSENSQAERVIGNSNLADENKRKTLIFFGLLKSDPDIAQ